MPRYPIRFAFSPQQNERIEAVVTAPRQLCSIVHGTVLDLEGLRIRQAVVRLFSGIKDDLKPVADTLTDDDGEFVLGPLEAEKNYVIKVYTDGVKLRELTIKPLKK